MNPIKPTEKQEQCEHNWYCTRYAYSKAARTETYIYVCLKCTFMKTKVEHIKIEAESLNLK